MEILMVSGIVYAGSICLYQVYRPTYGVTDFDPMMLIWALIVVVVLLSIAVGLLWPRDGGKR